MSSFDIFTQILLNSRGGNQKYLGINAVKKVSYFDGWMPNEIENDIIKIIYS